MFPAELKMSPASCMCSPLFEIVPSFAKTRHKHDGPKAASEERKRDLIKKKYNRLGSLQSIFGPLFLHLYGRKKSQRGGHQPYVSREIIPYCQKGGIDVAHRYYSYCTRRFILAKRHNHKDRRVAVKSATSTATPF